MVTIEIISLRLSLYIFMIDCFDRLSWHCGTKFEVPTNLGAMADSLNLGAMTDSLAAMVLSEVPTNLGAMADSLDLGAMTDSLAAMVLRYRLTLALWPTPWTLAL